MSDKPTVQLQTFLRSGEVQNRIDELLKDRASQFTTSLMSAINQNIALQQCEPWSVLTAAITAASLDLPIEPGLGYAYIIPYWDNTNRIQKAQFQIGAKGFKQLALRTGKYKLINDTDVREGEYKGKDRRTGEHRFDWVDDEAKRSELKAVGYLSFIRLTTGYEKELYMTVEQLTSHAKKYSKLFQKGGGQWANDFENMARKTVIKLLISKHGVTTSHIQTALLADQAAVEEDSYKYIDNQPKEGEQEDGKDDKQSS